jgi:uncharacterized protein with HEPN domain
MPPRDLRAYLFDIAEACRLVDDFTRGKSADDYGHEPLLRSGVERHLEIVGEALSHHPAALTDRIPEAPRIIAFRNQLAHGYASVSDDIVWGIVESSLPVLRARVEAFLHELDGPGR